MHVLEADSLAVGLLQPLVDVPERERPGLVADEVALGRRNRKLPVEVGVGEAILRELERLARLDQAAVPDGQGVEVGKRVAGDLRGGYRRTRAMFSPKRFGMLA